MQVQKQVGEGQIQKTILHPKWKNRIDGTRIRWFPYCTAQYTDAGQIEVLRKLSFERRTLAWKASRDGRVYVACAHHNTHIVYPELDTNASYSYYQREILEQSFRLRYGNGIDVRGRALFLLQQALMKEIPRRNATIWSIGKQSLIDSGFWLYPENNSP